MSSDDKHKAPQNPPTTGKQTPREWALQSLLPADDPIFKGGAIIKFVNTTSYTRDGQPIKTMTGMPDIGAFFRNSQRGQRARLLEEERDRIAKLRQAGRVASSPLLSIPPEYQQTRFRLHHAVTSWPATFVIVSAYATTGESWPAERNEQADAELGREIERLGGWHARLTGYSPETGHAEPSWAVQLHYESGLELGRRFDQDAIFVVDDLNLSLGYCADGRQSADIGPFLERVDEPEEDDR